MNNYNLFRLLLQVSDIQAVLLQYLHHEKLSYSYLSTLSWYNYVFITKVVADFDLADL